MSRVNEYRALASPSLMCLSSGDPIMTAFRMSWELRNLAGEEKECQSEYSVSCMNDSHFVVSCMDCNYIGSPDLDRMF